MVKLIGMLSRFKPARVLVIGDLMLDTYTTGKVRRISPEAPVSVLNVQSQVSRPGGAGNVILNLISLGASVAVIGRVGRDLAGEEIQTALSEEGADLQGLFAQKGYRTPVKNRFIADSQQVLRVDFEEITSLSEELEQKVLEKLPTLIKGCEVIAISDYGKGFLTRLLISSVIELARKEGIPVIVDPKGEDFSKYRGATILKPNLTEAYAAAKLPQDASLDIVAGEILKIAGVEKLLITRSQEGISLFDRFGQRFDFPVRSKEVKDVTGAGDTVLATLCLALANGLDSQDGAQLANISAGMVIERIGCARISLSDMAERLIELDLDNKVFDGDHLFALQQSLKGRRFVVLSLESGHGMSTALFKSIRNLSVKNPQAKLLIFVRDSSPDREFISLLSSLSDVDFILFDCPDLDMVCATLQPEEIFSIESPGRPALVAL
jgi:rfaE bifunctional protein kinase chain/domain